MYQKLCFKPKISKDKGQKVVKSANENGSKNAISKIGFKEDNN